MIAVFTSKMIFLNMNEWEGILERLIIIITMIMLYNDNILLELNLRGWILYALINNINLL